MTIEFERMFHPVGHGAFFTEKFKYKDGKVFNVVYDCGCKDKSEKIILKKEVDSFFKRGDSRNVFFISHFDRDHVNGIEFLIPYLSRRTHLMIPFNYELLYLSESSTVLIYLKKVIETFENATNSSNFRNIHFIRSSNDSNSEDDIIPIEDIPSSSFVDSGTTFGVCKENSNEYHYKWLYVPFNLNNDLKARLKFESDVCKEFGKTPEQLQATDLDKITINKLHDIYENLKKSSSINKTVKSQKSNGRRTINENSLVLLSKSTSLLAHFPFECIHCFYWNYNFFLMDEYYFDGSCFYTGDSILSSKRAYINLKKKLSNYTSVPIGLFQIPHHGSRECYSKALLNDHSLFFTHLLTLDNMI